MNPRVRVRRQDRKSLAMKVTPGGVLVLVPEGLGAESAEVQTFIREGLGRLPLLPPAPPEERLAKEDLLAQVQVWAQRLGVEVTRVQLRRMRAKWASISTAGTLTLASDLTRLPQRLVDYVLCHELLHLRLPNHTRDYHLLLSRHIPDWQERERELAAWVLALADGEAG